MIYSAATNRMVTMENVQFARNAATDLGSAICGTQGNTTVDLRHVTIANNTVNIFHLKNNGQKRELRPFIPTKITICLPMLQSQTIRKELYVILHPSTWLIQVYTKIQIPKILQLVQVVNFLECSRLILVLVLVFETNVLYAVAIMLAFQDVIWVCLV